MAVYLDIPGVIGESLSNCSNWNCKIEVMNSQTPAISTSASMQTGTGTASGGANVGHLYITKTMDRSTPLLFNYLCTANPIKVMYLRVSSAGAPSTAASTFNGYFESETYTLGNVIVSSYNTTGDPGAGALPIENWTFSATMIAETWVEVKVLPDGSSQLSGAFTHGFDFGANTPWTPPAGPAPSQCTPGGC